MKSSLNSYHRENTQVSVHYESETINSQGARVTLCVTLKKKLRLDFVVGSPMYYDLNFRPYNNIYKFYEAIQRVFKDSAR